MNELPEWIYEGAEVWLNRVRGGWSRSVDPTKATVTRFTAQRIIVESHGSSQELAFLKDGLQGIGKASDYEIVSGDHPAVITAHRAAAVRSAMRELRAVFKDMGLGNRIGWDELPDALEAAFRFHEASFAAISALEEAREQYGPGQPRKERS